MAKTKTTPVTPMLSETWTLSPVATLGSSVRAEGILLELRARLPFPSRKALAISGKTLTLAMPEEDETAFRSASAIVSKALETIETLPVIPREIEDILTISTSERRRWLNDGRLPSAGTRTVKLRGRARQITFHVFDPAMVEDLLNRGAPDEWREEDAEAKALNRERAAYQAKLTRSLKKPAKAPRKTKAGTSDSAAQLNGWEEFSRTGLLR